jgi:PqqD family protein of HPr-rel-A system
MNRVTPPPPSSAKLTGAVLGATAVFKITRCHCWLSASDNPMPADAMTNVSSLPPCQFKVWEDEAVITNPASGDTYCLKPLTLTLNQTCREHPGYTPDEFVTTPATRQSVTDSPQLHALAAATLNGLSKIGLLEFA